MCLFFVSLSSTSDFILRGIAKRRLTSPHCTHPDKHSIFLCISSKLSVILHAKFEFSLFFLSWMCLSTDRKAEPQRRQQSSPVLKTPLIPDGYTTLKTSMIPHGYTIVEIIQILINPLLIASIRLPRRPVLGMKLLINLYLLPESNSDDYIPPC